MFNDFKGLLVDDPIESMTRSFLADRFEQVRGLKGAIAAYEARLITATNRLGDRGVDGAGMMRTAGRVSDRSAAQAAKRAESLESLPETREALAEGRITEEHVDSVAAAAQKVSPEKADRELVERASSTPASVFAKESREWTTGNRVDDGADELTVQRRNRCGRKWINSDKMHAFYSELDRENGEAVSASLQERYDQLWNDDGGQDGSPDEIRTPDQRMADAFVSLMTGAATEASTPRHPKHLVNAIYDIGAQTDETGRPLASLVVDGEPLPTAVLERIACQANITPMIFDGPGRPIWVGRDNRSATPAQWRALIARDRGCVGCSAAANRCEAHHIVPWNRWGSTDIENLVLVCSRCHHDVHDRNMALRRSNGRWHIVSRDGPAPVPHADLPPGHQLTLTA